MPAASTDRRVSRWGKPDGEPATRVYPTPGRDARMACTLALLHVLDLPDESSREELAELATEGRRESPQRPVVRNGGTDWQEVEQRLGVLKIVDPACGAGDFLLAMLDLLDEVTAAVERRTGNERPPSERRTSIVRQNLFGVEVQPEVLARAQQRMAAEAVTAPPNLVCADSLVERGGFSWRHTFPRASAGGGFDLVIGNPPYVRHERIADPRGRVSRTRYREEVMRTLESRLPHRISRSAGAGRSDLCALFTLLGLTLLRPGGVLAFVLPVAQFEAQYGEVLSRFTRTAGIRATVLESATHRSFVAGVNTATLIARTGSRDLSGLGRTTYLGRPDASRVPALLEAIRGAPAVTVRRPDRLAAIVERLQALTVSLSELGELRYAVKTGINAFFYPDEATIWRFGIELPFHRPVVRSPREVAGIAIDLSAATSTLFCCRDCPSDLSERGQLGALSYVQWGAQQRTRLGVPWPETPSCRGRRPWYRLALPPPADILCPRFFDRRFFFPVAPGPVLADQTWYGLRLADPSAELKQLVAALLNSSLSYLFVETRGRSGLGLGVRQYALGDMATLPVLDVRALARSDHAPIVEAFVQLAARPVRPVDEEIAQPDRHALDGAIARAMGLRAELMEQARQTLCRMVSRRQERARSVRCFDARA